MRRRTWFDTRMTSSTHCRWGILGTAGIARKNWQAIRDAGNAELVAVASRGIERASQFIGECQSEVPFPQIPVPVGAYEELLQRADIDAVYVPLPTGLRKEWILRAIAAGKHVLMEKPAGVSVSDVAEIISAAREKNVQIMDGVMFMHGRRLRRLREVLEAGDGGIGEIRRMTAQFSFAGGKDFLQTNIRTSADLEPMGCLGDLGWYCVRLMLWAMRYDMPQRVTARIHSQVRQPGAALGVPTELSAELEFAGGVSAGFHCSFIAEHAEWAMISGTRGYVQVSDFVLPFAEQKPRLEIVRSKFAIQGCQFAMHEGRTVDDVAEVPNNDPASPEAAMMRTFSALVVSGETDSVWSEMILKTQTVVNAILDAAGRGAGQSVVVEWSA